MKSTTLLGRVWEGWKNVARKIGDVQARVLLTVLYFLVIAPFALAVRAATDPLAIKPKSSRGWRPRLDAPGTPLDSARRQS